MMSQPGAPILSVVIACYHDGPMLLEAVASAERNERGRHEVIVVSDGTTDPATLALLAGLEERGLQVIRQANAGPAAARNTGIRHARGRYILPLDADNRLRPEYIDRGIEILDADPSVDVVYGDMELFGGQTGRKRIAAFSLPRMLQQNYIDTCAVFRKTAWERVGGYDDKIPVYGVEDWDFWLCLGASGSKFHHVDEVLFEYRLREGSLTSHILRPEPSDAVRRYLREKPAPMNFGQLGQALTWDFVVDAFRAAPLRTLARLVWRAWFPGWRGRWKRGHS